MGTALPLAKCPDFNKKKALSDNGEDLFLLKSGWQDSNLRPRRPERRALPGCATPRKQADGAACFHLPIVAAEKSLRTRKFEGFQERLLFRRSGRIRTYDLQHPMLARYQATLHPDWYWRDKGKRFFGLRASCPKETSPPPPPAGQNSRYPASRKLLVSASPHLPLGLVITGRLIAEAR